jgi:hypothetical protein
MEREVAGIGKPEYARNPCQSKGWKKNPSAWTPVVDRQTGKIDFKETDPGWRNNWKDEKSADKTPRYVTLFEFDPIIAGVLYSQYGM